MLKSELSNLQRKNSYESEYNAKKIPSDMLTVGEWELSTDAIDKLNLLLCCAPAILVH